MALRGPFSEDGENQLEPPQKRQPPPRSRSCGEAAKLRRVKSDHFPRSTVASCKSRKKNSTGGRVDAQRVFFNIPVSLIVDQSGKLHSSQVEWRIPRTRSGIYDSEQPCDQLPSPNSPGFPLLSLCFLGSDSCKPSEGQSESQSSLSCHCVRGNVPGDARRPRAHRSFKRCLPLTRS